MIEKKWKKFLIAIAEIIVQWAIVFGLIVQWAIGFGLCVLCTNLACMFFGFNWSIEFAAGCFFLMIMLWWFTWHGNN